MEVYSYDYKVANGQKYYSEELKIIKQCCQNKVLYSKDFEETIPCENPTPQAQKCLRDNIEKITKGTFDQYGREFFKELHPFARLYIGETCKVNSILFVSAKQFSCVSRTVNGGEKRLTGILRFF